MKAIHYIWQAEKWPHFTWHEAELITQLSRCNFLRGRLLGRVQALGMNMGREAHAEVLIAEVVQTSAIEGKTLDVGSVRSSVADKLGLPYAGIARRDRYTDGLVDVLLDATSRCDEPLSRERLHRWQAALFPTGYSGMRKILVGAFRKSAPMRVVSGPLGKEKVHFEAPPGPRVKEEMVQFLRWWKVSRNDMDGILRAALAGFRFATIHPYEDGNGRIARVLTDMALAQDEGATLRYYSLSAQIVEERKDYYKILEKCQKGSLDITEWLIWFLGCFERAIVRSEAIISRVLSKARFWEIHGQVQLTDRQRKVVNRLLDSGTGGFEGGLTTRKYVGMTKASRATAYREISDLVKKGLLDRNRGRGRSASYDIVWPEE